MFDIRRILIIFVVGVLFSVFVYSTAEAIHPGPDYNEYCESRFNAPKLQHGCEELDLQGSDACYQEGGFITYTYGADGCATEWKCDFCQQDYEEANKEHNFWVFIITSILGLAGVIIALYLPKGGVNEWIGSGLMLGGLISIFIGTAVYFGDLHRILRPIIILVELLLVIYLTYKKLNTKNK